MFKHTVSCSRPAVPAWTDDFGNVVGAARPAASFKAAFAPPMTQAGSRIIDGVLREQTVTKPTLYAIGRPDVRSGDPITVDGDSGWQVDGDPAEWKSPFTGREWPLVIELRRTVG